MKSVTAIQRWNDKY